MSKFNFLFILLLTSCTNEVVENGIQIVNQESTFKVLAERDPNSPLVISKEKRGTYQTKAVLDLKDFLGYSYRFNTIPIGSAENIMYPVVDIKKLEKEYPTYTSEKSINLSFAEQFSYANFERYTANSKMSKKVKTGFSFNLGLFKIGAKHTMEQIFTSSSINEANSIFGELNVSIRSKMFSLQSSSNIYNKIKLDYLHSTFSDELYNTHPSELVSNYGGFAMFGYITGGYASGIYHGIYNYNESSESKEKGMNLDISASYGFNAASASGEFGIGKNYAHGATGSNKIQNLRASVKTIGGSLASTSFTVPKDINSINIDLSNWVASLSNTKTHAIIDMTDEGLVPISELVLEENLVLRINDCLKSSDSKIKSLIEPQIEIYYVDGKKAGTQISFIMVYLRSRYSDLIPIDGAIYDNTQIDPNMIEEYKNKIQSKLGLKIISYKYPTMPFIEESDMGTTMILDKIKVFHDTKRSIHYLVDTENKYAYSLHYDFLLDTYAIRNFYNSLPKIQISDNELLKYRCVAL